MEISKIARCLAAAAVALLLGSTTVSAQAAQPAVFNVNAPTANVHLSPSTGSAVIGRVTRGTVLTVQRELGSWVKVEYPAAKDGVGYVHLSVGNVVRRLTPQPGAAAQPSTASGQSAAPGRMPVRAPSPTDQPQTAAPMRTTYVRPPSHVIGLGALGALSSGPTMGAGVSVRTWPHDRIGFQVQGSRFAFTSATAAGRTTSMQLTPSVLLAPKDRVSDSFWLRPYVGSGLTFHRQTLGDVVPGTSVSDNSTSFRAFGGAELTFPNAPQFGLSADVGYLWSKTPFPGFDAGGMGFSLAGHWYIR